MLRLATWIPLTLGGAIGASVYAQTRTKILNDVVYSTPDIQVVHRPGTTNTGRGLARFDGRLDYHQLSYGSFAGMVTGYIFGKISRVLVAIVVGTVLTAEFLQFQGQLDFSPWANAIYDWSAEKIHNGISVKDPSFKFGFGAAFLVAAFNA